MFYGTGVFAKYFLAIYTPIVLLLIFSRMWKWRKHALEREAWLSTSINAAPPKRLLGPTGKAIAMGCVLLAIAVLVALLLVSTWG